METKYIFLDYTFKNYEEVLYYLAGQLKNDEVVDDLFLDKIIARENKYPTGLRFPNVNIALPHTDYNPFKKNNLCFVRLKNPVYVKRMDFPKLKIPVTFILLVLPTDSNQQLKLLKKIIKLFKDPHMVARLGKTKSKEEIIGIFEE